MLAVVVAATGSEGQEPGGGEAAYFRAVALYFDLPESEIAILGDWHLPAEEIPVVLFIARRAGISPEALVALRGSGYSWVTLAHRYGIGAAALHVPLRDASSAGALELLYQRFVATGPDEWAAIPLDEDQIISLVNVRVLSQALGLPPEEIARRTSATLSFVELYAQLVR